MRTVLVLASISLACCFSNRSVANDEDDAPPVAPGGFYTQGNRIYGEQGKQQMFRGVSRPGFGDKLDGDFLMHENEFPEMAKWGVNVVRIPMNQHYWLTDERGYRDKIRQVINWTLDNGMTAIADLHRSVHDGAVIDLPMADDHLWSSGRSFADGVQGQWTAFSSNYTTNRKTSPRKSGCMVASWASKTYVGMQQLYDAIRELGAHKPDSDRGIELGI